MAVANMVAVSHGCSIMVSTRTAQAGSDYCQHSSARLRAWSRQYHSLAEVVVCGEKVVVEVARRRLHVAALLRVLNDNLHDSSKRSEPETQKLLL